RLIHQSGTACQVKFYTFTKVKPPSFYIALKIKFERLKPSNTPCRTSAIRLRYHDNPHDDAHPKEEENSAKSQKMFEHGTYVFGESSSGQVNESEPGPSTLGNEEQSNDFDFQMGSYAIDDDKLPTKKVSQELREEMSHTIDEAKLLKVVDKMLRQRCTLGDEHHYHIDQMQNFLKNDIVWESRKDILSLLFLQKPTPVVQSCQRDPKACALSLHGYVTPNLIKDNVEYLQLFEEQIEERLKHHDQIRRWEMGVGDEEGSSPSTKTLPNGLKGGTQASKTSGDPSDPLDVDSDPDIHEFPSAKELKDFTDCHWVVVHEREREKDKAFAELDGNRYDKKGQHPSKTGQNQAQYGKHGKVNSQKSTRS
nr:hypothetical protein [Tanacetum cinerariifolium]GFA02795.1 hypothetical protein [Tanacetum cinerariifolium]